MVHCRLLATLGADLTPIGSLRFSADGALLAMGLEDERVRISTVGLGDNPVEVAHLGVSVEGYALPRLAFAPNRPLLAWTQRNGVVRFWEPPGAPVTPLAGTQILATDVAFSPDGRWLVVGGRDGTLSVWDALSGMLGTSVSAVHGPLRRPNDVRSVFRLRLSPDGAMLAFFSWTLRGSVALWREHLAHDQAPKLEEHVLLIPPTHSISDLRFAPDGQLLAVAATEEGEPPGERLVRIFQAQSGGELGAFTIPENDYAADLAFSPDGRFLAVAGRRTGAVWLYAMQSLEEVGRFAAHGEGPVPAPESGASRLTAMEWSSATGLLATAGLDRLDREGAIKLLGPQGAVALFTWYAEAERERDEYPADYPANIGKYLGPFQGIVKLWEVTPGQ